VVSVLAAGHRIAGADPAEDGGFLYVILSEGK
jgi:hypothetical protein